MMGCGKSTVRRVKVTVALSGIPMGVGDAFIAAYVHAFSKNGNDNKKCLDFALAASALKNTIPGDFNLVTEEEVEEII